MQSSPKMAQPAAYYVFQLLVVLLAVESSTKTSKLAAMASTTDVQLIGSIFSNKVF